MPLCMRLKYLAPQVVLVGSRHPRLRRRVSPPLHYTIIGIALVVPLLRLLLFSLLLFILGFIRDVHIGLTDNRQ